MKDKEALKLALEALETYHGYMEPLLTVFGGPRVPAEKSTTYKVEKSIIAIKEALAQPEQELVACVAEVSTYDGYLRKEVVWNKRIDSFSLGTRFYTTPPQRTWVSLTDEDKKEYAAQDFGGNRLDAMDWAEKRLKEKNT